MQMMIANVFLEKKSLSGPTSGQKMLIGIHMLKCVKKQFLQCSLVLHTKIY